MKGFPKPRVESKPITCKCVGMRHPAVLYLTCNVYASQFDAVRYLRSYHTVIVHAFVVWSKCIGITALIYVLGRSEIL